MKVKVKRTDGSREVVELDDRQHYEVTVEGNDGQGDHPDDGLYWRYDIVPAANTREARKAVQEKIAASEEGRRQGEKVESVRALTHGEAAVMALNGYPELKVG